MAHRPDASLNRFAVLVTRPAAQAGALVAALRARGARVHVAPMLAIGPVERPPGSDAVALDGFDFVIVTSRNAVTYGLSWLARRGVSWPTGPAWFAVGESTAAALAPEGIAAIVPRDARSEGLLALPELADVAGRRILLLTGEGGRGLLESTLAARGASVTRLAVYRRDKPESAAASLGAFRDTCEPGLRRVALVTSREAMQNLLAQADWLPASDVSLIVASARIAEAARAAGVRQTIDARGADDESQLAALAALAQMPEEDRA